GLGSPQPDRRRASEKRDPLRLLARRATSHSMGGAVDDRLWTDLFLLEIRDRYLEHRHARWYRRRDRCRTPPQPRDRRPTLALSRHRADVRCILLLGVR